MDTLFPMQLLSTIQVPYDFDSHFRWRNLPPKLYDVIDNMKNDNENLHNLTVSAISADGLVSIAAEASADTVMRKFSSRNDTRPALEGF